MIKRKYSLSVAAPVTIAASAAAPVESEYEYEEYYGTEAYSATELNGGVSVSDAMILDEVISLANDLAKEDSDSS